MEPIVNGLKNEFESRIVFERRNAITVDGKIVMTTYGLRGHPSFVIIAPDGERLWSSVGLIDEDVLRSRLAKTLKPAQ